MAALSDHLLLLAILAYALAMLTYAAEYAFGNRSVVARVAVREHRRELVGAGAPVVDTLDEPGPVDLLDEPQPTEPQPTGPGADPRIAVWAGRAAATLTLVGWLAHLGCVVTRGFAAHRVPWGNMYEFVLAVTLVGATAWFVLLLRRPSIRPLGLFVTLALVILLGIDGVKLYTPVAPLVPALNSYWLKIHVTAAVTASGILMVGFVAAALTLIRTGHEAGKTRFPYSLGARLPAADGLERLAFRLHAFAFPIWTFAIICGAIWAEAAWGRYWGWDPKETWAFIAWVIYAGYLHARATPSVKRTIATWIAVVGWGAMMVNLFVVNLVVSGLHSYAGVN
ncbi:c-type cytochrome biogenesis protein CcsB [Rugosimonospora africana]|uniref:C-type cytochrome biogenesis protein CcsB n=1 Tax=Rugosimonospora africana TaxID=556532 RepID=A0A8J3VNP6_9ACTN|nr:c-type cytochrome biogenesis protein CcsB [Rugosimonospora africana]GIH13419.1 c-type cytochrome biogenesis protein CcsB [Rugosimonospora africana]